MDTGGQKIAFLVQIYRQYFVLFCPYNNVWLFCSVHMMISLEYKLYVEYMFEKVQNEKPFSWKKYYIESAEQFRLTAEKFIFLNINAVKFSIRLLRIRELIIILT